MSVLYHHGKANVVADAFIHMTMGSVSYVDERKKDLVKGVHILTRFGVRLADSPKGGFMVHHISESSSVVEVKSKQHIDTLLMELKKSVLNKFNESFSQWRGGLVCLGTKVDYVCRMLII